MHDCFVRFGRFVIAFVISILCVVDNGFADIKSACLAVSGVLTDCFFGSSFVFVNILHARLIGVAVVDLDSKIISGDRPIAPLRARRNRFRDVVVEHIEPARCGFIVIRSAK